MGWPLRGQPAQAGSVAGSARARAAALRIAASLRPSRAPLPRSSASRGWAPSSSSEAARASSSARSGRAAPWAGRARSPACARPSLRTVGRHGPSILSLEASRGPPHLPPGPTAQPVLLTLAALRSMAWADACGLCRWRGLLLPSGLPFCIGSSCPPELPASLPSSHSMVVGSLGSIRIASPAREAGRTCQIGNPATVGTAAAGSGMTSHDSEMLGRPVGAERIWMQRASQDVSAECHSFHSTRTGGSADAAPRHEEAALSESSHAMSHKVVREICLSYSACRRLGRTPVATMGRAVASSLYDSVARSCPTKCGGQRSVADGPETMSFLSDFAWVAAILLAGCAVVQVVVGATSRLALAPRMTWRSGEASRRFFAARPKVCASFHWEPV